MDYEPRSLLIDGRLSGREVLLHYSIFALQ